LIAAAEALARIGGARAAEALAAQLENPNPHVRPAVAKVLGEMGGARRSAN